MFGGETDFNHKKDMAPIAKLIFAMRKQKEEKIQQSNFIQKTIKDNKEMARKGKIALANFVLGDGETRNPHIQVPDVSQRSARLSTFAALEKIKEPTYKNSDGDEDDGDEDTSSDYKEQEFDDGGNKKRKQDNKRKEEDNDNDDEKFSRELDAAGNRVVRFNNGNVSFNPKNKTQNGKIDKTKDNWWFN